jgi:hypothetical protein
MTYRVLSKDEPLPLQHHNFRETQGIDIVWRGGDVIRPIGGNWMSEPWPKRVLHFFCPLRVLPLVRWRFGTEHPTVGYAGFKAFGVDLEAYKNWMPGEHVHDGSVALTPSWRFDADDH